VKLSSGMANFELGSLKKSKWREAPRGLKSNFRHFSITSQLYVENGVVEELNNRKDYLDAFFVARRSVKSGVLTEVLHNLTAIADESS
jgi:hypothetical protein